jgi:hypothetical protein
VRAGANVLLACDLCTIIDQSALLPPSRPTTKSVLTAGVDSQSATVMDHIIDPEKRASAVVERVSKALHCLFV